MPRKQDGLVPIGEAYGSLVANGAFPPHYLALSS